MGVQGRFRMENHHQFVKHLENYLNTHEINDEIRRDLLFSACKYGHLDVIKTLTTCNDINPSDENGLTLLHHAAKYGHLDIVIYYTEILENVNPGQISNDEFCGKTPLHYAAEEGHLAIIVYFFDILKNKNP